MRSKRKLWLQGLVTNAASGMVCVLSGQGNTFFDGMQMTVVRKTGLATVQSNHEKRGKERSKV
jgi:hypothetical protein